MMFDRLLFADEGVLHIGDFLGDEVPNPLPRGIRIGQYDDGTRCGGALQKINCFT